MNPGISPPLDETVEHEGLNLGANSVGTDGLSLVSEPDVEDELEIYHAAQQAVLKSKVMIVDDEPVNIKLAKKYLSQAGYEDFCMTTNPTRAMEMIAFEHPDVVLLDISMPEMSGLEVLDLIRSNARTVHIPVVILTARDDRETKRNALELGATDFLSKPVDASELALRVRSALMIKKHYDHLKTYAKIQELKVIERTAELSQTRLQVIHCLARAAEYRDNETGRHVIRVGRYSGIIARQLGLSPALAELIEHAAPLHDIGKIGIPDSILLKPGKLDQEEFDTMQQHCRLGKRVFERMSDDDWQTLQTHADVGSQILKGARSPLLEMAASISLTHHEKWDGSGYPLALAGENIPIEGRIVAVADVFDALSSERPYKKAFPLEKCLAILEEGRGQHFDTNVLDAFFARLEEIVKVQIRFSDI